MDVRVLLAIAEILDVTVTLQQSHGRHAATVVIDDIL